ncbi:hypothetical protein HPC62_19240 [Thermoleptolyngbya sichuanensis A183]|uniref:Uncharacterized protein n=1 Tax=Thermoleptolyngbya sichuanensis A183 TaxID=2737172 RepID=A0A6M8BD45_9CYAN|nr:MULTISPECIES: hypothetical protein [Thermoleptolyngbya]QKD84032.1 hypothetical protein HPC62_19240 [Thermoleptolyngbya sichuanensis A183]
MPLAPSTDRTLWDFAGIDGLQVARHLFGESIAHISPFQSLTTALQGYPCAVLRLCENNFRVALPQALALNELIRPLPWRVWVARSPYLTALTLPVGPGLSWLYRRATTKPLYTLQPLPGDRAVPARLDGIAVLIWHHEWLGQPRLDLHLATADVPLVRAQMADAGMEEDQRAIAP